MKISTNTRYALRFLARLASCPDGICAAHKPISREGESIVCLPHRVVITVRTVEDEGGPDIVA